MTRPFDGGAPAGCQLLCALALLISLAACRSAPKVDIEGTPQEMYDSMVRDMERRGGTAGVFLDGVDRAEQRCNELMAREERGELTTATDCFHAGAVLVRSSRIEQLLIAESLGRRAVILGDNRGKPVAAEAIDRQALVRGEPQPFGTQYAYNALKSRWQLYLVDPEVTDADRDAMGLPPLAWFEDRVRQLNESEKLETFQERVGLPSNDR